MDGQLSLEDCFITRNELRAKYGLVGLYEMHNTIIPPNEIEHEKEMCAYWVYYNATCRAGVPPKSFAEWKKEIERKSCTVAECDRTTESEEIWID